VIQFPTYKNASDSEDKEHRIDAMDEEIEFLKSHEVWDLVGPPTGSKTVGIKLREVSMVKLKDAKHDLLLKDVLSDLVNHWLSNLSLSYYFLQYSIN